jgi:GYF domain 2
MRKYYYKDDQGQQLGPVKLDKLGSIGLKLTTPVWYDPLPKWTTAGEVDELKSLFATVTAAPVTESVKEATAATIIKAPAAQVADAKRKYYYKDAQGQQQGPFKLDKLKLVNLKPATPVWYDPLPKWTTAGEVDELKSLLATVTAAPAIEPVKEAVVATAIKIPAAQVADAKRKYYYKDAQGQQQGPFKLDKLKLVNLKPATPVWYDPLPKWTTAGEVDELKSLILAVEEKTVTAPVAVSLPEVKEIKEVEHTAEPVINEPIAEIKETIISTEAGNGSSIPGAKEVTVLAEPLTNTLNTESKEAAVSAEGGNGNGSSKPEIKEETMVAEPIAETIIPAATEEIKEVTSPEKKELVTPVAPVIVMNDATVTFTVSTSASSGSINPATAAPPAAARRTRSKGPAWISWLFSLLVLGGAGYYVYQDINKNNNDGFGKNILPVSIDSNDKTTGQNDLKLQVQETPVTTNGTTTPVETVVVNRNDNKTTANTQKATAAANATKKAEELKKQMEKDRIAKEKAAEEESNRIKAVAAAAAAKDLQVRTNWPKYISFGSLDYSSKGGKIEAFDIPVYNGTDVTLDKVTIRVDYSKKDRKIVKTETVTVYNIPPKTVVNGKGPESKRGDKVNVYFTGISSRQLHFCYPQNNGNPADPYYCD